MVIYNIHQIIYSINQITLEGMNMWNIVGQPPQPARRQQGQLPRKGPALLENTKREINNY